MKKSMMKHAKESVGLGVLSMGGLGAMGAMNNILGMPAQAGNVTGVVGVGLTLTNVGKMVGVGMDIILTKKGKTGNKYVDKII